MKRFIPVARICVLLLTVAGASVATGWAEQPPPAQADPPARLDPIAARIVPETYPLTDFPVSPLRVAVERFVSDRNGLQRRFPVDQSEARRVRLRTFYQEWRDELNQLDFASFETAGRVDFLIWDNHLDRQLGLLDREEERLTEALHLIPFAVTIVELQEARRRHDTLDPRRAAEALDELNRSIKEVRKQLEEVLKEEEDASRPSRTVAHRAAGHAESLRRQLEQWYEHYEGYDPLFTWWASKPYEIVEETLRDYITFIQEKLVGYKKGEDPPIVGDPIGREELIRELRFEMIPYGPEDLVRIAEEEFAWCEEQMLRASNDLGFGDDWHRAMKYVKNLHVEPGRQPDLIRDLAWEAIDFVESRDLLTVPSLAKEIWRIEMLSPERQKVSPFFLGGEVIRVAFPTHEMEHEDKLMSLRGNNRHFARATVQHELIPGHHLQGFMNERNHPHRRAFSTPFWTEGWALYWEMLLWDLGFPQSPEDRIGMLFWRMHRCARIIFSLNFHLGTMSPQACIDLLVERVGHERANATAEVRRSFEGTYPPLYQIAYMIGGLQFRALHGELVQSGRMSHRDFHDAVLQHNSIPVELVRAILTEAELSRDFRSEWYFAGGR